jgi:hypothetical protein
MLTKTLIEYLEEEKWVSEPLNGNENIRFFAMEVSNTMLDCIADADDVQNKFIFFTIYPLSVPTELRVDMAVVLTRINYNLFLGNFEMDFDDGELRLRTSIIADNITKDILAHLININIVSMDEHLSIFNDLIINGKTLQEVVLQINPQV